MTPLQDSGPAGRVLVHLEPQLLTQLLRQMLAARGITAFDVATAAGAPADVAVVGAATPAGLDAKVVVRLEGSGWELPTVVEIRTPGVAQPRVLEVADVDELIDLLIALALAHPPHPAQA